MDRRTFLKGTVVLPVLPKVEGLALLAGRPAILSSSTICNGQWQDLPVGWARFCDFGDAAPRWPNVQDPNKPHIGGFQFGSITEVLDHIDFRSSQVAHALGDCACVGDDARDAEVVERNLSWWRRGDDVDEFTPPHCFRPTHLKLQCDDECDIAGYCECLWAVLHYPVRVHGAG
ncbi:hypothetical protein BH24ACT26_BH24ACT26_08090 [soil metagenome]